MSEEVRVDLLVGRQTLAPALRSTGDASVKAAAGAKILAEGLEKQRKAADVAAGASITLAKADKILADAEQELARDALEADVALRREGEAAQDSARKNREAGRSAQGASAGFSLLAGSAVALGPALLPVAGVATAGIVGLGAAAVAAGSAFGVFGIAAKYHLTQMQETLKKVQAANLAANKAGASKAAIENAKALTAQFKKEYGTLAVSTEKLHTAWEKFTSQPVVNSVLARGMGLLTEALPKLEPLFSLGAQAANKFLGAIQGFVRGGGLDRLVKTLTSAARPALGGFLAILRNLGSAFGSLGPVALGFSGHVVAALVRLSGEFARWAAGRGQAAFQRFFTAMRQAAPRVISLLGSLAAVVPALVRGMAPLAPVSLAIATALAKLVAAAPPGLITAAAVAFIAWKGAFQGFAVPVGQAWKGIVKFAAAAEGATVAETIAAAATRAWGIAMDALPWVALAAAVIAVAFVIIKYHRQIWAFVQRVWDDILGAIGAVFRWVKRNWPYIAGALAGPIGLAVVAIVKNWDKILSGVKAVGHDVVTFFGNLRGWILGAFKTATNWLYNKGKDIISGLWSGLKAIWKSVISWFHGIPGALLRAIGIHSPPKWAIEAGQHIMGGLLKGLGLGSGSLAAWGRGIAGRVGGAVSSSMAVAIGKSMAAAMGWTGPQWDALYKLWNRESGWRWNALNPTSGAYGIPQALPASKMASAGPDWRTNPATQERWGMGYIADRYENPVRAWLHEMAFGWYGSGLQGGVFTRPTLIGVGESGPERVDVTPMSQVAPAARAWSVGAVPKTERVPAAVPGSSLLRAQAVIHAAVAALQAHEAGDYAGLRHAFRVSFLGAEHTPKWLRSHKQWAALSWAAQHPAARAWLHGPAHRHWVTADLEHLARLQERETAAFKAVAGGDATVTNLAALTRVAGLESAALQHMDALRHRPGGHPGWVSGVEWWLRGLRGAAAAGRTALGAQFHVYDSGGVLPPGVTMAVNRTSRPEMVVPAGRGGAAVVNNFHIDVKVAPGAHPREVGRQVASALNEYFRGGGKISNGRGRSFP